LKPEAMVNKFNEIRFGEASPEKAGVGGSIPSLATTSPSTENQSLGGPRSCF